MKTRNRRAIGFTVAAVVAVACILTVASGSPVLEAAVTDRAVSPSLIYLPLVIRPEYVYLPYVSKVEVMPAPYNLNAQDIVLQLYDMPPGYALDEEESGPVDLSDALVQMGAVDGYEVTYTNFDLFFTGTPYVYNLALVFRAADGAHSYIQRVRQNIEDDPQGTLVSCPTLGDETMAGRVEAEDDPYVAYLIAFRKGNLAVGMGTGGLSGVAKFDDALSFARKALDIVNDQVRAGARVTGSEGNRSQAPVEPAPSWMITGARHHIRNLWAVLLTSES